VGALNLKHNNRGPCFKMWLSVSKAKQPLTECSLVVFLNHFGSDAQDLTEIANVGP